MCKSIPYKVTEEGNIDLFTGGRMENMYHADDRYSNFLEEQVKELKAEKIQSGFGNMLRVLTGSRQRTRHRQLTGIPPMPTTSDFTPVTNTEVIPVVTPPAPTEMEQIKPTQSVPVLLVEAPKQPYIDNRLGSSYITETQITQIEHLSYDYSISSLYSLTQEYLKNHLNEQIK